jgi:hypothetical protein
MGKNRTLSFFSPFNRFPRGRPARYACYFAGPFVAGCIGGVLVAAGAPVVFVLDCLPQPASETSDAARTRITIILTADFPSTAP